MNIPDKLAKYKMLVRMYHKTLDLMSERGVAALDEKVRESLSYARVITDDVFNEKNMLARDEQITLLDLGSGVGLPGIPIAVMCPNIQVILVERRRKRANFLQIVLSKLELENVIIIADDVRDFAGNALADFQLNSVSCVTAQAVGTFLNNYCLTRHLHSDTVTLISRRAKDYAAEISALKQTLTSGYHLHLAQVAQTAHNDIVADDRMNGNIKSEQIATVLAEEGGELEPFYVRDVPINEHSCIVAVSLPGRIQCHMS